ncbi:hypothetical protein [Vibrio maritimus]|uniref:hypothetical protein n=1 Tax=Vibrio maritimus TaxID=990268 RepID=UPI001F459831|nr:hypothetical protein [Vibrio maritimus]
MRILNINSLEITFTNLDEITAIKNIKSKRSYSEVIVLIKEGELGLDNSLKVSSLYEKIIAPLSQLKLKVISDIHMKFELKKFIDSLSNYNVIFSLTEDDKINDTLLTNNVEFLTKSQLDDIIYCNSWT